MKLSKAIILCGYAENEIQAINLIALGRIFVNDTYINPRTQDLNLIELKPGNVKIACLDKAYVLTVDS